MKSRSGKKLLLKGTINSEREKEREEKEAALQKEKDDAAAAAQKRKDDAAAAKKKKQDKKESIISLILNFLNNGKTV